MEPVFMVLAQSSAIAASIAIDEGGAVQNVDCAKLKPGLLKAEQVLKRPTKAKKK